MNLLWNVWYRSIDRLTRVFKTLVGANSGGPSYFPVIENELVYSTTPLLIENNLLSSFLSSSRVGTTPYTRMLLRFSSYTPLLCRLAKPSFKLEAVNRTSFHVLLFKRQELLAGKLLVSAAHVTVVSIQCHGCQRVALDSL